MVWSPEACVYMGHLASATGGEGQIEFEFIEHVGPWTRSASCHRKETRWLHPHLWHLELVELGVGFTVCCEESSRCLTGLPVRNELNMPFCVL